MKIQEMTDNDLERLRVASIRARDVAVLYLCAVARGDLMDPELSAEAARAQCARLIPF